MCKTIEDWLVDLKAVHNSLIWLNTHRQMFWDLQEIAGDSCWVGDPGLLLQFINDSHLVAHAIALRKLLDTGNRDISLANCIKDIASERVVLTRANYLAEYEKAFPGDLDWQKRGESDFDRICQSPGAPSFPIARAKRHLEWLKQGIPGRLKEFVNKVYAHDSKDKPAPMKHRHLDRILRVYNDLASHYCLAATGTSTSLDTLIGADKGTWSKPLKAPWELDQMYDTHWACGLPDRTSWKQTSWQFYGVPRR